MLFAVIADEVVYVNDAREVIIAALLVLAMKLRRDCFGISGIIAVRAINLCIKY